jgi:cob(I)alamin adenosyltransferase
MGNRLSRIYTRTGDDGTTGLGDGSRVPKDSLRVEAFGTVDELNSAIGVLLATPGIPPGVSASLTEVQHELFDLGGELCIPGHRAIKAEHVAHLEKSLDEFNDALPPLKEFILPGGGPAAAACHLARAIARRAERRMWTLARSERVSPEVAQYLNRLSDLLFVLARVLARHEQGVEVLWRHDRGKAK